MDHLEPPPKSILEMPVDLNPTTLTPPTSIPM